MLVGMGGVWVVWTVRLSVDCSLFCLVIVVGRLLVGMVWRVFVGLYVRTNRLIQNMILPLLCKYFVE